MTKVVEIRIVYLRTTRLEAARLPRQGHRAAGGAAS